MTYRQAVRYFNKIIRLKSIFCEDGNVPDAEARQVWQCLVTALVREGRIFIDSCEEWPFPGTT
jgi:hypothetical protein